MGYSGARLPDDDFIFIHPFDTAKTPFEFMMLIPDFTYDTSSDRFAITIGSPVNFEKESGHSSASDIKIILEGKKLGFVEPALLPQFHKWIDGGLSISAVIERINGTKEKSKPS